MPHSQRTPRRIWQVRDGAWRQTRDYLATEEPLSIRLEAGDESQTIALTMRTPGHDYELAAGFLYNEGVIKGNEAIHTMAYCEPVGGAPQEYNELAVNLRARTLPEMPGLERHFFTTSACGFCGKLMLDDLATRALPNLADEIRVTPALLTSLPSKLRAAQTLFEETGGLHAAALFDLQGNLLSLREDVGRHNALDKLVGWGVIGGHLPFADRIVLVSGRASYELLQKARIAGAPIFAAVSAPSSLAVSLARQFDITLVGFLRDGRFNVYSRSDRISRNDTTDNPGNAP